MTTVDTVDNPDARIVLRYRPALPIDAVWQQLAREVAGNIHYSRCPAPKCGRWFLRSAGRSDRQYCSHACQMRQLRAGLRGDVSSKAD